MVSESTRCPACGEPVTTITQPGPVTYVLGPCGHQVDVDVYEELVDGVADESA